MTRCPTCNGEGYVKLSDGVNSGNIVCITCLGKGGVMDETINHPAHYGGDTTYEVIKVIEAWGLDTSFCLGNAVKYIARAGKKHKNTVEDLKKAQWYLAREITKLEETRHGM